ncbi:hypothetical protein N657DRAFT_564771 [Parathielavia appendiculata]|uniref:Zn(2)-C6 fungal-type domain-containing protein n=1 Tax=Parathielavia appendiculata TaxID=2587402 RepID=A0AAN6U7B1_9PEZI|nr:hypothetical protein N657DRAFT_564771 [Parathielavia appendiculata]
MGFATALESRFRSAIPDTPPEALTPDSASFPIRRTEESWHPRAPPSPPMSNYDPTVKAIDMSSSGKGSEETTSRRESAPEDSPPARQQLPSLSSLFGPSSQMPPLHSSFSDRPGPYTTSSASSPLDHPSRPTVGSSSYFPPSISSVSQPRSLLDSRFQDRPQIPSLSQVFPGPLSPVPRLDQRQDGRPEYSSGSQWSVQHEASREYSFGSRSHQYYQPSLDRYHPSHLQGGRDGSRAEFRDPLAPHTPGQNPPSTPTSSVGSEAPPTKDGLGPKIWTGTHFLPRFVRAAEVPGEGMCYFYDDGSHCKTVIDGEAVNAHWGVTKAGKPRKRLAIACITCREKKIKCDPDYPRCVQCEKFGRVCKFKNAPRGGHNTSPSTPPAEPEDLRRLGAISIPRPTTDLTRPSSHSSESVSPRTTLRPLSPDPTHSGPRKQARVGYEHYSPTAGQRSPLVSTPVSAGPPFHASWRQPEALPRIHEDVLRGAWQTDSYVFRVGR